MADDQASPEAVARSAYNRWRAGQTYEAERRSDYNRSQVWRNDEAFRRSTYNWSYQHPGSTIGEPVQDQRNPSVTDALFRTPGADIIVAPDRTIVDFDDGTVIANADRTLTVTTNRGTVRVNDPALAADMTAAGNRSTSATGRGPVLLVEDMDRLMGDAQRAIDESLRPSPTPRGQTGGRKTPPR